MYDGLEDIFAARPDDPIRRSLEEEQACEGTPAPRPTKGMVTWQDAVSRVADALPRDDLTSTQRRTQRRSRWLSDRCVERTTVLIARGECYSSSVALVRLDRIAASARRRRWALDGVAFRAVVHRGHLAAETLARMGAAGNIPNAEVVAANGSQHRPTGVSWADAAKWWGGRLDGLVSVHDASLENGAKLCVPEEDVDMWCKSLRNCARMPCERAAARLMGAKRPDQTWKQWSATHELMKKKGKGRLTRQEARVLAADAHPWASPEKVEATAEVIRKSINR